MRTKIVQSIARYVTSLTWLVVLLILSHEFSPIGDVGVAIGISGINPSATDPLSQILTISKSRDQGATWIADDIVEPLYGFPWAMAVPSGNVAYILCSDKIIKYFP